MSPRQAENESLTADDASVRKEKLDDVDTVPPSPDSNESLESTEDSKTAADKSNKRFSLSPRVKGLLLRFLPSALVWIGWWTWALLDPETRLGRFSEPNPYKGDYYYMSITMVFGSFVAGATSEGGGAVAFPVMTLLLGVPPTVARDFSMAIQSFGMTTAAITIVGLRAPVDWEAIKLSSLGGVVGLAGGLHFVAPYLPSNYAKMLFVCLFFAFAAALWKLNRSEERKVYFNCAESDEALIVVKRRMKELGAETDSVISRVESMVRMELNQEEEKKWNNDDQHVEEVEDVEAAFSDLPFAHDDERRRKKLRIKRWAVLIGSGLFGGIATSVLGSGLDMASFSVLTLYFRVSEKNATPTSVILMAINTVLGTLFRIAGLGGRLPEVDHNAVWSFLSCCIPVVVVGAPFGSTIAAKYMDRYALARLLYFLDICQFITALVVIKPWTDWILALTSVLVLVFGSLFFMVLGNWGEHRTRDFLAHEGSDGSDGGGNQAEKEEKADQPDEVKSSEGETDEAEEEKSAEYFP